MFWLNIELRYRIYFFADDLLLFGKASQSQTQVLINFLNQFFSASGEMVSVEKTKVYVPKDVQPALVNCLRNIYDFSISVNLGNTWGTSVLREKYSCGSEF